METSSAGTGGEAQSPTLPLPPPKAAQISMEDFIETATRAVLRAMAAGLNPQPLPPKEGGADVGFDPQPDPPTRASSPLNPQPLPPFVTVGIVVMAPAEVAEPRSKFV